MSSFFLSLVKIDDGFNLLRTVYVLSFLLIASRFQSLENIVLKRNKNHDNDQSRKKEEKALIELIPLIICFE